ncbi:hypothetical protein [Vibrio harveyi]|uniref:capsular polysaccharide export protein, LipB/KpsS family n=1 Tax=Vibrio harveyi TaxID=669 RepID=UPI0024B73BB6|nr:hypothetical protein [Vibrio harveyi]WHP62509.1 hypothetical protein QMY49_13525 [Vibrio harveyi]
MKILVYCDCIERMKFYNTIFSNYKNMFVFLSDKYSVYIKIKRQGYKSYWLKRSNSHHAPKDEIAKSIEVMNNIISITDAKLFYSSVFSSLEYILRLEGFSHIVIWNGSTIAGNAIRAFKEKQKEVKTLFLEISNIPGKLVVDPVGVNAESSIYYNNSILNDMPKVPHSEYITWRNEYLQQKRNYVPPQAVIKSKVNYLSVVDRIFSLVFSSPILDQRSFLEKIIQKRKQRIVISYSNLIPSDYVFLPLQVTSDTQIKLNSDVDNIEAINFAKEYAFKRKLILAIKVHPAETDINFIGYVKSIESEFIKVVNSDTNELVNNAKSVIVINSTVGLESMILEKEVIVLGRAIYNKFDQEMLKKYILRYLLSIDYFNPKPLDDKLLKHFIERAS